MAQQKQRRRGRQVQSSRTSRACCSRVIASISAATWNRHVATVRSFTRYCGRTRILERRRVMPALRDDGGETGARHRAVTELVLDDGERLAVLRARRFARGRAATGTRRLPRPGRPRMGRRGGARAVGCGLWSRGIVRQPDLPARQPTAPRLRRKRVVFAHEQRGAQALPAPPRLALAGLGRSSSRGTGPSPRSRRAISDNTPPPFRPPILKSVPTRAWVEPVTTPPFQP